MKISRQFLGKNYKQFSRMSEQLNVVITTWLDYPKQKSINCQFSEKKKCEYS